MNNNVDMKALMNMLSKMDKKDLEQGLNRVNQMLKTNDVSQIVDKFKNNKN